MAKPKPSNTQASIPMPTISPTSIESNSSSKESPINHYMNLAFWCSLLIMLITIWIIGYDSGYNSDEMDMNAYGKANIAYYNSGGKDTSYLAPSLGDGLVLASSLKFYGSGFEYIASGLTALIGDDYEYNTRHILNQLFAVLGIMFTGLLAWCIFDIRAGLLSIWLLFFTPIFNGLAIFDTKDIPFLTAYISTIYFFITYFHNYQKPNWGVLIGLTLSLWLLLSIRIGGIILFPFFGLFIAYKYITDVKIRETILKWLPKLALAFLIALLLMVLCWPYVLEDPINRIIEAINVNKNFPQKIPVNFEGEVIDSRELPKHYLIKSMIITLPIIISILTIIGLINVVLLQKRLSNSLGLWLIVCVSIFPIVYATQSGMALYNSWRHLLFVYPGIVIIAAVGTFLLFDYIGNCKLQLIGITVILVGLIAPIKFIFQYAPLQYTYFNNIVGGVQGAKYTYDTDYWQISIKDGIDWLMKNEPIQQSKDTQIITTNAFSVANYYVKKRYPNLKVKVQRLGYKSIFAAEGVYTVFNNLFVDPFYLEYCFPSPYSIYEKKVDDVTMTFVGKDTNRYLNKGYKQFQANNNIVADSLFSLYMNEIKFDLNSNIHLAKHMGMIALAKLGVDKPQEAYAIVIKCIKQYPDDPISNLALGICYLSQQKWSEAKRYLSYASTQPSTKSLAYYYLSVIGNR